ncbi:MAG: M23 family metallopeptidase [bacterium]
MQKGGRYCGLRVLALGAALFLFAPACVKRAPRSGDQEKTAKKNSSEDGERCGLICTIKKQSREREEESNKRGRSSDEGHNWLRRDKDEKEGEGSRAGHGKGVYHTVKKGQTLWRICHTYGADIKEVSRVNRISDPGRLSVGQKIWIPGAEGVKTVPRASPGSGGGRRDQNSPPTKHVDLLFPVPGGKVSSGYGNRDGRMHEGIDISAPRGSRVVAADDGKVVYSDDTIRGYGNMIIIKHAGNISTVYAHNSRNLVGTGEIVKRGQKIAEVGKTGRATGCHLHFEVRVGEKPADPGYYLSR